MKTNDQILKDFKQFIEDKCKALWDEDGGSTEDFDFDDYATVVDSGLEFIADLVSKPENESYELVVNYETEYLDTETGIIYSVIKDLKSDAFIQIYCMLSLGHYSETYVDELSEVLDTAEIVRQVKKEVIEYVSIDI